MRLMACEAKCNRTPTPFFLEGFDIIKETTYVRNFTFGYNLLEADLNNHSAKYLLER